MVSKKMKPAPLATGTGLGNVSCWAVSDNRGNTPPTPELQERFLVSRFRLGADRARVVAALHFGELSR